MKKIAIMATIKDRAFLAKRAIESIIGQVDELYLSLNYTHERIYDGKPWTDILFDGKIPDKILVSETVNAKGDAERYIQEHLYHFLHSHKPCYFFSVDDDMIYPANYVETLIQGIERHNCPCSFHGRKIHNPLKNYHHDFKNQTYYGYFNPLGEDRVIDVPGTGVMGWRSDMIDLFYEKFSRKNMADIEVARLAKEQDVKLMVLSHPSGWITPITHSGTTIWDKNSKESKETEIINEVMFGKAAGIKLSVSMIVKNETSCLAKCLESVSGADEIIVCDTGSTDDTVEIAKRYTDKVFTDYLWNNKFDEARNHALTKCSGDWIMHIDADNVLEDGGMAKIRMAIEEADRQGADGVRVKLQATDGTSYHYFPSLLKKGVKWEFWAHNAPMTKYKIDSDITVYYHRSKAHNLNPDRTLNILLAAIQDEKESEKSRYYYYLAREYWYRQNYREAIKWWMQYTNMSTFQAEIDDANLMLARCHQRIGDWKTARHYCMKAIMGNPDFKEAVMYMALLYNQNKYLRDRWYGFALQCQNRGVLFVRNTDYLLKWVTG